MKFVGRITLGYIFGYISLAMLCGAACAAVRMAYADWASRQGDARQAARAVRLDPGNATYWLRWADLMDAAADHRAEPLERAVALSPRDARVWIEAGLRAESRGETARAERCLLEAARVSKLYQPRWTLANFYCRRGDAARFWPWARSAMEWSYGDAHPLFDLCWRMSGDAALIRARAIPENRRILCQYVAWLLAAGKVDAAVPVGRALAAAATPEERGAVLEYGERMLAERRGEDALGAWNALCRARAVPYDPLDAAAGRSLTNGGFAKAPLGAGFDWRTASIDGVLPVWNGSPAYLRISFSGRQPERCDVLWQFIPVMPGARYRLRSECRTEGIARASGLRWTAASLGGAEIGARSDELSGESWGEAGARFTVPPDARFLRLALAYTRAPGTTRIEGAAELRRVWLEREP